MGLGIEIFSPLTTVSFSELKGIRVRVGGGVEWEGEGGMAQILGLLLSIEREAEDKDEGKDKDSADLTVWKRSRAQEMTFET
jgi:hypothetical protein